MPAKFDLRAFLKSSARHQSSMSGGATCLYAISCPGHVKVGIASDPKRRLANLQSAAPFKLTLEYAMRLRSRTAAVLAERTAHDMLREHSTSGEWFSLSADEVWPLLDGICRHADLLEEMRDQHTEAGGDPTDRKFTRSLHRQMHGAAPQRAEYVHFNGL